MRRPQVSYLKVGITSDAGWSCEVVTKGSRSGTPKVSLVTSVLEVGTAEG